MTLNNINTLRKDRGFTIVELLIVIIIIAILAAIVIVAYNGITNRAKTSKALAAAQVVQQKAEAYNAEVGYYPVDTAAFGTNAAKSYYVTGVNWLGAAPTSTTVPTNESSVFFEKCPSTATGSSVTGTKLTYWDYAGNAAVAITAGTGC